jgi:transposase
VGASDIAYAQPLLDNAYIPSLRGRPRKRCRWLLADKGYDAEALRRYCDRYRMQPVIPLRTMKRKPKPGLPRLFDRPKYRQRNIIERMFGWLKENRRIVTRFDKLAKSYAAMVSLACAMRCLRQYFSYSAQEGAGLVCLFADGAHLDWSFDVEHGKLLNLQSLEQPF